MTEFSYDFQDPSTGEIPKNTPVKDHLLHQIKNAGLLEQIHDLASVNTLLDSVERITTIGSFVLKLPEVPLIEMRDIKFADGKQSAQGSVIVRNEKPVILLNADLIRNMSVFRQPDGHKDTHQFQFARDIVYIEKTIANELPHSWQYVFDKDSYMKSMAMGLVLRFIGNRELYEQDEGELLAQKFAHDLLSFMKNMTLSEIGHLEADNKLRIFLLDKVQNYEKLLQV
ncbi:MAG TPA: hypothetical protein VMR81_05130 [Patescibacteria group bacterium]|nr:hypothetical protein [Patescibacteria group bacterium]